MPRWRALENSTLVCLLLAAATLTVYLPVGELDFLCYDDYQYVTRNPHVQIGLTWGGLGWAFTHFHAGNWHPITWLSHMLDCQLFGMHPAGHHVINLVIHMTNSLLLFRLLRSLTGAFWRSAMVAALFALHPLHVESVAWVAERKDVLSALFFLLTLQAYARYAGVRGQESGMPNGQGGVQPGKPRPAVTGPGTTATNQWSPRRFPRSAFYLLSVIWFALGLMSKPMLVTTPFVLLLLDYWPLHRLGPKTEGSRVRDLLQLVWEKFPFFVLSGLLCVVTVLAQRAGGAMAPLAGLPLELRVMNAIDAYFRYLWKLIWPSDLAVIYTFADSHAASEAPLAGLVLLAVTFVLLSQSRRRPYLPMGWLWYLGMLVPVIGLLQVGNQTMADRYMYLPAIGLFIMVAWGGAELGFAHPRLRIPMAGAAALALGGCLLTAQAQVHYWQNSETLFRRALAATRNNFVAWFHLGFYLAEQGQFRQAEICYRKALAIHPGYQQALNNLAASLAAQKRYEEAITNYEAALRLAPDQPVVRANYAEALAASGQPAAATAQYREAVRLDPGHIKARHNLAGLLAQDGNLDEAVTQYRQVLRLEPGLGESRLSLGSALAEQGKYDEATRELSALLQREPTNVPARLELGMTLSRQGKMDEAIAQYTELLRVSPTEAAAHFHLAQTLAKAGKLQDSVRHYRAALDARPDFVEALNNLAWMLAASSDGAIRNGPEAVRLAERACQLTGQKQPMLLGTLAAAYAECGRYHEAAQTAENARRLAEQLNEPEVAARNNQLLRLYQSRKPVRDDL